MKSMKKITLIISLLVLIISTANTQPIQEGETQLNAGLGLSNFGIPVYAGIEFGLENNLSVGGELSYRKYGAYSVYSPSIITIAGLGNYHFNELLELPSEWDVYGGLTLGYSIWSDNDVYDFDWFRGSGLYIAGQIGGRYFFNENFAVNLELGGGNYSGGKIGITYKL